MEALSGLLFCMTRAGPGCSAIIQKTSGRCVHTPILCCSVILVIIANFAILDKRHRHARPLSGHRHKGFSAVLRQIHPPHPVSRISAAAMEVITAERHNAAGRNGNRNTRIITRVSVALAARTNKINSSIQVPANRAIQYRIPVALAGPADKIDAI